MSFDLDELAGNERPRPAGEHYDDGSADVFHPMVTISNSDTGHGRLSVRAGLWRMICKNGIVAEKEFAQIHLGRAHDASGDFLSTETIAAGNEQLFREIGDFIVHALNREVMLEVGQKLGVLKGVDIKDKSKKVVETRIAPQLELDEDETQALIDRYLHEAEEHGPNGYAMLNAVTWLAHEQEDPRRGLEYEEVAGKLIESPALLEV